MVFFAYIIEAVMQAAAVLLSIWLIRWLGSMSPRSNRIGGKILIPVILVFLSAMIPIAYFLPAGFFQKWFRRIGYFWMVAEACLFVGIILTSVIAKRIARSGNRSKKEVMRGAFGKVTTWIVLILTAVFCIYGTWNASSNIQVTAYDVQVDEDLGELDGLRVVLVADQHFGYNAGCRLAEKMTEKINSLNPDLVVFAGDTFDNQYDAVDDPDRLAGILAGIQSRYGTYSCFGNHDVEDNLVFGFSFAKGKQLTDPRYEEFFQKAAIKGLADETVLIDNSFYLMGRRDLSKTGNESGTRLGPMELTDPLDKNRLILCIDHEPPTKSAAAEIEASGIDVLLSGHTHNGQIAPVNLVLKFIGFNSYGYKVKDGLQSFTTSGVGAFGPYMRAGTKSEIMLIDLSRTSG